jgi:hypothetical protein
MTALETAIRSNDWERAALYLLLGLARATERVPPQSLAALIALLSGDEDDEDADER